MRRSLSELEENFEFLEPAVPPPKRVRVRPAAPAAAAAAVGVLPPQPSPRGRGGGGGGGAEVVAPPMPLIQKKKHLKGERTCPHCLRPKQRQSVWLDGHAWGKACPHEKASISDTMAHKAKLRKQQREKHKQQ